MENDTGINPKWGAFVLLLTIAHFAAITTLLKLLGIFQPFGLFLAGGAWVWFAMPRVNSWLVMNTPFSKLWDWARS